MKRLVPIPIFCLLFFLAACGSNSGGKTKPVINTDAGTGGSSVDACTAAGHKCNTHQTCDESGDTPQCVCTDAYTGDSCGECADGFQDNDGDGLCAPTCDTVQLDCGGFGSCDDSSGTAVCACEGHHAGDACGVCADGFQDNDADGTCAPDCASSDLHCGSYGYCDASSGEAQCVCNPGYNGDQCTTCADGFQDNDADGVCTPTCTESGLACGDHGMCDASGGQPMCACDQGYTGDACDQCADGFQDNDADGTCAPTCDTAGLDCGDHGTCDDTSGAAVCVCDPRFDGAACDQCAAGYQDNDADGTCAPNCDTAGLDCGSYGTCDDSSGEAVCSCDSAYVGTQCTSCAPGYQDNDVNGVCEPTCATAGVDCGTHGVCVSSSGTPGCYCDTGYTGSSCGQCDTGYQDNDGDGVCAPDCSTAGLACGNHGSCEDTSGTAICACDTGYMGTTCGGCAAGYQDNDADGSCTADCAHAGLSCGANSACDDSSGTAACTCDTGYTGSACDQCATGYQDNDANGTCEPDCTTAGLSCAPQQACDDSSGMPTCACASGYQDHDGDGVCQVDCANYARDCAGMGLVCDDSYGTAQCIEPPPQSCAAILQATPGSPDGTYTLYYHGHLAEPFLVYCHAMASGTPAEYLPLPASPNANAFTNLHSGVTTTYQRVRLDPATLRVNITDATFATSSPTGQGDVPFATTGSCSGSYGRSTVDLTGTPFAVDDTFNWYGYCAYGTASFSNAAQIIDLMGHGLCGDIGPADFAAEHGHTGCGDERPSNGSTDPFVLQLKYINP